jgi:hypothetical protein
MGTHFHKCVEIECSGIGEKPTDLIIKEDDRWLAFLADIPRPPYVNFEVKEVREVRINESYVQLVAQADYLFAGGVGELKTTAHYDYEKYSESAQWRVYLFVFNALYVKYHVAEIKEATDKETDYDFKIIDINIFQFESYPALESEIMEFIEGFTAFAKQEGLAHYLLYDTEIGKYTHRNYGTI